MLLLPRTYPAGITIPLALALTLTILPSAAAAQNIGGWSPAVSVDPARQLGVNTAANDGCPIEAPDGHLLFFATNRVPATNLDIWVAYRNVDGGDYANAEPLPAPVNTSAAEFCPTPLAGNRLLFVSTRSNSCGSGNDADIHFTQLRMAPTPAWTEPVALPCNEVTGINTPFEEFSPSLVQAKGRTFLFFSSNRDTRVAGVHKLYSSELLADNTWTPAQPIDKLNAEGFSNARPNVRQDGLEIVFDSNRAGTYDIYVATRGSLDGEWSHPRPLGPNVNSDTADETRPSLSRDALHLYFGSTRANAQLGGAGGDIYVSSRARASHATMWR